MKDKFINLKLKSELYEALKKKADEMNVSLAAAVRIAIVEFTKKV